MNIMVIFDCILYPYNKICNPIIDLIYKMV